MSGDLDRLECLVDWLSADMLRFVLTVLAAATIAVAASMAAGLLAPGYRAGCGWAAAPGS